MPDILPLLKCFAPYLAAATISQVITAIIPMSGRVTMLGMSRWTDKGGSYQSIQRFFYTVIPWSQLFWTFL
jgi:putative transposase